MQQASNYELSALRKEKSTPLTSNHPYLNKSLNEEINISSNSGKGLHFGHQSPRLNGVPIYKITKSVTTVTLLPKNPAQRPNVFARGQLLGTNNMEISLKGEVQFQGNFKGVVEPQFTEPGQKYFEGEIKNIKIIKLTKQDGKTPNEEQWNEIKGITNFKGYFKGYFLHFNQNQIVPSSIFQKKASKVEYYVPAMVRLDLRKISEINLEKSSAEIAAILHVDIQLNREVLTDIYDFKENKFTKKTKLSVDFHRSKPLVLPFYNPDDFQETDQEVQYEWDDVWEGIDLEVDWDEIQMRMSYSIRMVYTAQIDNSHGVFYSPFNLSILKIIIDFHSVKLGSKGKIWINCCNFTDYDELAQNPYVCFHDLKNKIANQSNHKLIYQKNIDRLTKIDISRFVDQGQYKIASNRLTLFPYHKRVFKNKNNVTSDINWLLGSYNKEDLLAQPQVKSVQQAFLSGQSQIFSLSQWQFVHVQIPIYKYPVIDMIRIFVPILILSVISMLIFVQQNAYDYGGFTELAKRIASGCSLLIAYVALIPMIRSNLPPTPSITLVQILIYLSTIPNFLAIISVFITNYSGVDQFFAKYQPFIDPLFLISFIICILSIITIMIMMIVYATKDYKSQYTIYGFQQSGMENLRAPAFSKHIKDIRSLRCEYQIVQLPIQTPVESFD